MGFTKRIRSYNNGIHEKLKSIGHPIMLTELWLKVAKSTLERLIPFKNGIHGWGWLRWFKMSNLDLSMKIG
jgi:hypothetical protein